MNKRPIGIFDSGVGGLTVLREIERALPGENLVYFGDTARVPYGNKSRSTVIKFSRQSVKFLLSKKVKAIVVACNTSSALALDNLKVSFKIPIVGVIEAGVKKAITASTNNKIAVIGTKSTIASRSYEKEITKRDSQVKVYSQSCPLFVPLAEEGILRGKIVNDIIKMYLGKIKAKKVGVVILGCTHYPLLKAEISKYLKGVTVIDSARAVALYTKELLANKRLLNSGRGARKEFYVSDQPASFSKSAKLFLKREITKPRIANA
ncbi:MAG: glutamate racemase [Candidatus Omnitrophica bacterium]|nr:glutamate racemase [Candidatus Omnitrophota bacterium]